jgi:hypothetical protein
VALTNYIESAVEKNKALAEKYPSEIPNEVCNHAIISGVKVENSPGFKIGDYTPLFETDYEKVFIWTHTKDQYSSVISEVSLNINELNYWKNIGEVLRLAAARAHLFEHITETNYNWIYYFEPNNSIEESDFLFSDHISEGTFNGSVYKFSFFYEIIAFVELLLRDDKFYTALSLFLNSFETHWFCLHCELSKPEFRRHLSHEPYKWEEAQMIPKMESALVQSCRAVEAILGKPGNKYIKNKVKRAKQRWKSAVDIDPDDIYFKTETSYYDYYYQMFELRNDSAHSFGNLPFYLSRKLTIEAQSFAFLIIDSYAKKHLKEIEEAAKILHFNGEAFKRDNPDCSTKLTKE